MNSPVRPVYKSDARGRVALTERLADWSSMAHGAFAANTVRAWKADWEIFGEYCQGIGAHSMPAMAETVRGFVFECLAKQKKPATIRRYVSTIGRAHRAAGVADPTATETVKLAFKEMGRSVPARQRQARGWCGVRLRSSWSSMCATCGHPRSSVGGGRVRHHVSARRVGEFAD